MKLWELITLLQRIYTVHGDLPVRLETDEAYNNFDSECISIEISTKTDIKTLFIGK